MKSFGRKCENYLRVAQIISVLTELYANQSYNQELWSAEEYLAEFQHHDAITGTHEVHVEKMFQEHLLSAQNDSFLYIQNSFQQLILKDNVFLLFFFFFFFFFFFSLLEKIVDNPNSNINY